MKQIISLAIVDDHQIVIDGIQSLLKGHANFRVAIECTHPEKMPELLKDNEIGRASCRERV